MSSSTRFTLRGRNPDVLSCIANLSNDEVFTPPEFANRMLDTLAEGWAASHNGADIWADPTVTFLDPCTKSGVFLREITRRLIDGLAAHIPDLEARVEHILTKQVYGIAITQITSLLARRSLYCSKHAKGSHSIAKTFASDAGNIWFERLQHTWDGDKCRYCGAGRSVFNRAEGLESHAYAFIHADNIKTRLGRMFGGKMQFDVIIGNPPYQLNDGGFGTSAVPIYHFFVDQAKKLQPKYMCMVTPARWYAGGRGLDDFRESMLNDDQLRIIEDYPDSNDVFSGTQIKGGVCYFLWEKDSHGMVTVRTHDNKGLINEVTRPLLENGVEVFIRFNEAVHIFQKIMNLETNQSGNFALNHEKKFSRYVSALKPYGFRTFFKGRKTSKDGDVKIYQNGGIGYVSLSEVQKNLHTVNKWKVFIPRAGSGSDSFPHSILGKPFIGEPGSICTETYILIGSFETESIAVNVMSYISTKLFRFLVLLHKPSQDASQSVYTFVPLQDFSQSWSDSKLYEKYGLNDADIAFIDKMIRPMDLNSTTVEELLVQEDE
jgi:hypothetical protein